MKYAQQPHPCTCLGGYCFKNFGCINREKKASKAKPATPPPRKEGYVLNGEWVEIPPSTVRSWKP